jgi:Tfp pilus assembly protein PilE
MFNKKGAMFGLDARIALAIFGALSVISGAALYSAIQEAKVIAAIAEMNEVGKAYEAYYLDTGTELNLIANPYLEIQELVESTKTGWKGPYLPYKISTNIRLNNGKYTMIIYELKDGPWAGSTEADWINAKCDLNNVTGNCGTWIATTSLPIDIINALDLKIDGEKDYTTGKVRYFKSNGAGNYVMIRYGNSNRY